MAEVLRTRVWRHGEEGSPTYRTPIPVGQSVKPSGLISGKDDRQGLEHCRIILTTGLGRRGVRKDSRPATSHKGGPGDSVAALADNDRFLTTARDFDPKSFELATCGLTARTAPLSRGRYPPPTPSRADHASIRCSPAPMP